MKFSVFTVCLPEYDTTESIALLKELDADGVEWRVGAPCPAQKPDNYVFEDRYWTYNKSTLDISRIDIDANHIKELCVKAGLEIPMLCTYLSFTDIEDISRTVVAAKVMDCKNIRIQSPMFDKSVDYTLQFDSAKEHVKTLEKLAKDNDLRFCFEIHMNHIIPSASAAYRLVEGTDPTYIGVIFDPGNMVFEGYEDYRLGIQLLGKYLAHVHIKDAIWQRYDDSSGGKGKWMPTWVPIGTGHVDFAYLVENLKEIKYDGYLSIEDFSNEATTKEKMKYNFDFINNLV